MNSQSVNFLAHELVAALGLAKDANDYAVKVFPIAIKLARGLEQLDLEELLEPNYGCDVQSAGFARTTIVARPNNLEFLVSNLSTEMISRFSPYLTGLAIAVIENIEGQKT